MNILVLNWRDITHPWAGGAERHIHELSKYWVKQKHYVTILASKYPGSLKSELIDGIKIIRVSNTYLIFFYAPLYYLFYLRNEKYDFIIDVSHGLPFFMPLITRKKVAIIIHHNHEKLWQTEFNKYIAKIGIFLEKKIVPLIYKNNLCITLSESTKKELNNLGFKKVYAIPPGIDTKMYKPSIKRSKEPLIIYLGRLRKYKRVDILLKLFPNLKKQIPGLKLVIIGTGQDKDRLEYLSRQLNLGKDVIFKGYVSEEEKITYLQKAWALVFPSLIEGWGLVAMEAAACGTPTIGFKVNGVSDAIVNKKTGILAKNKSEFKSGIIRIIKDNKFRKLVSKNCIINSVYKKWNFPANNVLNLFENEI